MRRVEKVGALFLANRAFGAFAKKITKNSSFSPSLAHPCAPLAFEPLSNNIAAPRSTELLQQQQQQWQQQQQQDAENLHSSRHHRGGDRL